MISQLSQIIVSQEEISSLFKALSEPSRLAILQVLRQQCAGGCEVSSARAEQTVSEIASQLDLGLSTVSHHLKELRRSGIIRCERRGQRVHCSINQEALERAAAFLRES